MDTDTIRAIAQGRGIGESTARKLTASIRHADFRCAGQTFTMRYPEAFTDALRNGPFVRVHPAIEEAATAIFHEELVREVERTTNRLAILTFYRDAQEGDTLTVPADGSVPIFNGEPWVERIQTAIAACSVLG